MHTTPIIPQSRGRAIGSSYTPWKCGFDRSPLHVEFMFFIVARRETFLGTLWFYPVNVVPPLIHTHYIKPLSQIYAILAADSVSNLNT